MHIITTLCFSLFAGGGWHAMYSDPEQYGRQRVYLHTDRERFRRFRLLPDGIGCTIRFLTNQIISR